MESTSSDNSYNTQISNNSEGEIQLLPNSI